MARIARIDFPSQWPTMFDDISTLVQSASVNQNLIQLSNLLNILNQLVKAFSVTRFGAARTGFHAAAPSIIRLIGGIYLVATQTWMEHKDSLTEYLAFMEVGYIALKVTGKVLAEGYQRVHQAPEAIEIFGEMTQHFQGYIMIYNTQQSDLVAKHIKALGKIFSHIFERQPVSFVLLPTSLSVLQTYMSVMQEKAMLIQNVGSEELYIGNTEFNEEIAEFWEKVVVQGLSLFRQSIGLFYKNGTLKVTFRTPSDKDDAKKASEMMKTDLFNEQNITGMVNILLTAYLKLTPRDLESWKDDPEEWIAEEMKETWDYQARPCSERVLVDLLTNFKGFVSPMLIQFIQNSSSGDDVLLRDVAYNVFALASSAPFENINFDEMLVNVFLPQGYSHNTSNAVNSTQINSQYKLVRRRIAMIISQWVSVQCSSESRVKIYEFLLFCLNPEDPLNDNVIRLYACEALRFTVDEWDTRIEDFIPFLASFLNRLFPFITDTLSNVESKQFVLQVISVIIERVQHHIAPFANLILQALPVLWEESEEHLQMRCVILQTLASFISASGENSPNAYVISVPMLKVSIDPQSPLSPVLFEDALPLWLAMVENAPTPNEEILSLIPALIAIIRTKTENLPLELKLLESYILLSPEAVVSVSLDLFSIYTSYIPSLNLETLNWVSTTLGLIALQVPIESFAKQLYDSGLLKLLLTLLAAEVSPITNVEVLSVFSRIAYRDPDTFVQMLDATSLPDPTQVAALKKSHSRRSDDNESDEEEASHFALSNKDGLSISNANSASSKSPTSVLALIVSQLISKFDNMGHPRERKLNVLGTAALLRTGRVELVPYLHDIFIMWQQLIDEASETDVGDAEIYYSYADYANPKEYLVRSSTGKTLPESQDDRDELKAEEEAFSPETRRRRALHDLDPVHSVILKKYLQDSLFAFQNLSQDHHKALNSLDPGMLETLSMALGLS